MSSKKIRHFDIIFLCLQNKGILGIKDAMGKQLTQKEERYVRLRVEGYAKSNCAALAGYAFPEVEYVALERRQSIQKAIQALSLRKIGAELLPKALSVIGQMLEPNADIPAGVRLKAATYIVDKAVELREMDSVKDVADKNPLDMTTTELEVFIMRGRKVVQREAVKQELGIIDV